MHTCTEDKIKRKFIKILLQYLLTYGIMYIVAGVAQLVEQLIRNQQVAGSSPATSSMPVKKTGFFTLFSEVKYEPL